VKALVAKVNRLSRYPLSEREALAAFHTLKRTPEFFRRYLHRYLAYAELGSQAALEDTRAQVLSEASYLGLWQRLLPSDQAVLKLLAEGVTDLHSVSARTRLAEVLGLAKPVSGNTPQHALRRLQDEELVVKLEHGRYHILDEGLTEWLGHLELDS
jgi:hypothetical protein